MNTTDEARLSQLSETAMEGKEDYCLLTDNTRVDFIWDSGIGVLSVKRKRQALTSQRANDIVAYWDSLGHYQIQALRVGNLVKTDWIMAVKNCEAG